MVKKRKTAAELRAATPFFIDLGFSFGKGLKRTGAKMDLPGFRRAIAKYKVPVKIHKSASQGYSWATIRGGSGRSCAQAEKVMHAIRAAGKKYRVPMNVTGGIYFVRTATTKPKSRYIGRTSNFKKCPRWTKGK